MKKEYKIIGLMSGTSLDGVDIALCKFDKKNEQWNFKITNAETISYSDIWKNKLKTAGNLPTIEFLLFHKEYGKYLGNLVKQFLEKNNEKALYVASHGHTIFHQPEKSFTFQIGDGSEIAATAGISTISDFRSLDMAFGGNGAPLVPIGDEILFSQYDFCLNLGGFANISFNSNKRRIAFDICPVNIAINYLTMKINIPFDEDGKIAKSGKINFGLLEKLNNLDYYKNSYPKSLGREWFESNFLKIIESFSISIEDKLRTVYEHISIQIVRVVGNYTAGKILISGGGAHNTFLIELFEKKLKKQIVIPEKEIIDFKEALIFAFLGLLRIENKANCLSSATGAKFDNCGGVVHEILS